MTSLQPLHPVIRLVSFVVLTAFLALGNAADLFLAGSLLAGLYLAVARHAWPASRRMLRRMRWLFLSIAIIYLWLTPGEPLLSVPAPWNGWLPTVDGAREGAVRIAALALMAASASLLIQVTSREQMLAALRWLAAPLRHVGFPHERFAVRIALTLDAVGRVQDHVREALNEAPGGGPLERIGAVTAAVFRSALGEAEAAPCAAVTVPAQAAPAMLQWAVPLLLAAVLFAGRCLPV
jgi:energy-coupling factor transport system permease protein